MPGPTGPAGKSFTTTAPARQAVSASVGVNAPGTQGTPRAAIAPISAGVGVRADDIGRARRERRLGGLDVEHRSRPDQHPIAEVLR